MKEISAGVVIYRMTEEGPVFLLLYHGHGYWNFAKGKLEQDEKSFKAALREVREETGINPRDLRFEEWFKIYDRYVFMSKGERVSKLVIFYLAESATARVLLSSEHEGYGWFSYRDAVKMTRHKNLKTILKRAYDAIVPKPHTHRLRARGAPPRREDSAGQGNHV